MSKATHLVTAEELERFPSDDRRYELVEGRLIRMSPVGHQHWIVVAQVIYLLKQHLRDRSLGIVGTEIGFKLASDPDTVRAPDVAFIRQDRLPPGRHRGFWRGAPDLAIEVLSPDDRQGEMSAKVAEYLSRGVPVVVVIDPDAESVTVHRASGSMDLRRADEILDLDDVVPGFRCQLKDIFESD